jgi:hypothetical protein
LPSTDLDLAGERRLRQAGQRGQHLAGLVAVVVDGLLAQDDQARLLLVDQGLQQLGHGQRLQFIGALDQDAAVGADGHGRAQRFLALGDTAGHGDDFRHHALLLQAHGLLDGDLVKGVHAHLHVGDVDPRAVGLHAHLDVVVDNTLHGHQYLHVTRLLVGWLDGSG